VTNLADHLNLKERKYVVTGAGRTEAYERAGAAGVALERQRFVKAALRLIEATKYGPFVHDLEDALGISPFARGLMVILRDGIAPREWAGVLERLEQIARWQDGYDAQDDAREATR
jgi:hypothetical protein